MAELNIVEKVIALEGVDLLSNLNPDQLARIASLDVNFTISCYNKSGQPEPESE